MLKRIKQATLRSLKATGVFDRVADSKWRRERLLILCYHGTSLADEHLWRPGLYIDPSLLEQRMQILKAGGHSVLPLGEALARLRTRSLPARSVALTFDDGTYDFYKQAYPLLQRYGYPATVYQTTYYTDYQRPVFNLITSYLLWKKRGEIIPDGRDLGLAQPMDLRTEAGRHQVVLGMIGLAARERMTGADKDALAARLAKFLGLDFEALAATRIVQLMNAREVKEVAANGVDIQLHTHRHRTPVDENLFRREIRDNRERIEALVSSKPVHFCYPSGVYRREFFQWLAKEQVVSATTCDAGLVTRDSESFLIPRFIDNQLQTAIDFESWISGVGDTLALRRAATQKYVPVEV